MASRNYSNIAVETTLQSGIGSGDTSLTVASSSGWPTTPFMLVIDPGTANEELVLVGSKTGNTFESLTRGFGGTSAVAHNAGVDVKHVSVAEDYSLIWSHVHSGSGGDDTSPVAHTDLTTVGADDHHAQDHAARHLEDGADPLGWPGNFEVSGSTEVALFNTLTTTYQDIASVSISIPVAWGSWECQVWATWGQIENLSSENAAVDALIRIDGSDQQALEGLWGGPQEGWLIPGALVAHRTGMTTTGNRTVELRAKHRNNECELRDVTVFARAVRTS